MNDVYVNGVSLDDLKEKKAAIKKDAVVFVSDSIEKVTELVGKLVEATTQSEADIIASAAYELLNNANVVAGLADIAYLLPYYEEYGSYESGDVLSSIIEESDNPLLEHSYRDTTSLANLCSLLERMEGESKSWHSSTC